MTYHLFRRGYGRVLVLIAVTGFLFGFWSLEAGAASWDSRSVIKNYLTKNFPWAEVEILELNEPEMTSKVPPERIQMLQGPLGRAVFSLLFKSGEKGVVQAHIRALDWVATSRRPLKKGQRIEKEDVYLSLLDVRKMPKGALTHMEAAWGKTMNQSLGANVPLLEASLNEGPLIKKGQRVTLIAARPGLKITTSGEARQDGFAGRQIKVVTLDSKRFVQGTLVNENQVRVDF
ncbi:MAG: flagellar basal body P-ring formation chaperone FlgA [Thermodesulfobacteriota bacterium]